MIKPVICFEMIYKNESPREKIRKIADAGFEYVEFWSWRDKDIYDIRTACKETGVRVSNFSGQRVGDLVNRSTHDILIDDYRDALKIADILEVSALMILSNELGEEGVVVNPYEDIPEEEKTDAAVECLKKLTGYIPDGGSILIEPLNSIKDHIGYYLDSVEAADKILNKVDDSRIKILCDLYHQGIMGDDLIQLIKDYNGSIGYYHIADYPGRHEPGTGRGDWENVLEEIKISGFEGFVGFEYSPLNDSDESLSVIKKLWDSVF